MDIGYAILEASEKGALRTHVMFDCNLNSRQLELYLGFLVEKGLLERHRVAPSAKVEYKTTKLGHEYMRAYETLFQLIGRREFGVSGPVHAEEP